MQRKNRKLTEKILELYPSGECALEFSDAFELLVASRLSAQCTDVRVNIVTSEMFKKLKTPEDYAEADITEIENYIRSCGLYHTKARDIKAMSQMILDEFDGKTLKSRLTAQTIKYDSLGRWQINDYTIRKFDGLKETMVKGAAMDTMLDIEPKDFLISQNDQEMLTNPQLVEYIKKQKSRGVANIKNFEIEYEKRYASIATAFILTIIGLSLSSRKVRGGMGKNIGVGLLLSFSYILFTTVTSTFAVSGYTSPRLAMWIPNIIYTFIAIYLYRRAAR